MLRKYMFATLFKLLCLSPNIPRYLIPKGKVLIALTGADCSILG